MLLQLYRCVPPVVVLHRLGWSLVLLDWASAHSLRCLLRLGPELVRDQVTPSVAETQQEPEVLVTALETRFGKLLVD